MEINGAHPQICSNQPRSQIENFESKKKKNEEEDVQYKRRRRKKEVT